MRGTPGIEAPTIRIKAAYDVVRGDPFAAFSELDFDFRNPHSSGIALLSDGAQIDIVSPNTIKIIPTKDDYTVEVTGFDTKRDLQIAARKVPS